MTSPSLAAKRRRLGALFITVGWVGIVACIVGFAVGGYVGARDKVFGGWIVLTFFGCVAFAILAAYGVMLRHRATRDDES